MGTAPIPLHLLFVLPVWQFVMKCSEKLLFLWRNSVYMGLKELKDLVTL